MSIMRPIEPVAIEYDSRGHRATKVFPNAWEAKRFYVAKDRQGKRPKVRKVVKP